MWVRGVETQCASRKCCSCFSCSSLLAAMTQTWLNLIFSTSFLHWCVTSDLVWRWPITSGPTKTLNAEKCSFVTHGSACKRKIMSGERGKLLPRADQLFHSVILPSVSGALDVSGLLLLFAFCSLSPAFPGREYRGRLRCHPTRQRKLGCFSAYLPNRFGWDRRST